MWSSKRKPRCFAWRVKGAESANACSVYNTQLPITACRNACILIWSAVMPRPVYCAKIPRCNSRCIATMIVL